MDLVKHPGGSIEFFPTQLMHLPRGVMTLQRDPRAANHDYIPHSHFVLDRENVELLKQSSIGPTMARGDCVRHSRAFLNRIRSIQFRVICFALGPNGLASAFKRRGSEWVGWAESRHLINRRVVDDTGRNAVLSCPLKGIRQWTTQTDSRGAVALTDILAGLNGAKVFLAADSKQSDPKSGHFKISNLIFTAN
jgi:hypothetical protein